MDIPNWSAAHRIGRAASAIEEQRTGHVPQSVAVVLQDDTLVITLQGIFSAAEKARAETPDGAREVRQFYRELFETASDSLRQEIRRITGADVRRATAEVETTSGTMVQVCLLTRCVSAD